MKARFFVAMTAVGTAVLGHVAVAQVSDGTGTGSSPTEQVSELGEVIVTAQRREQRLQDVPVAVSVVSGSSLEQSNITSIQDMAERLPNVKVATGTISNSIAIRGVGSGPNAGFEQSVGTFVDGIYRSRSRSTQAALFDVDRVEVLEGPQTTFFGANAIAGAFSVTTRKPDNLFDYNGSAYYEPVTHEYDAQGAVDIPISQTLGARVAARASGSNGYVHNDVTGREGPHDRTGQGRLSLRWQPVDSYISDLRLEGSHSRDSDGLPFQLLACPPAASFALLPVDSCGRYLSQNGGQVDDRLDNHTSSGASYLNYDFIEAGWSNRVDVGSGSINAITGYFWQNFQSGQQSIPFPLTDAVGGTNGFPVYGGERYHQLSQEIRYQSAAGGVFEYMFGGYASWDRLDYRNSVGFRFLPFGAFNPIGTTTAATPIGGDIQVAQDDRTLSAFAAGSLRPIDHLRINFGGRYSSILKTANRDSTVGQSDTNASPGSYVPFVGATEAVFAGILGSNLNNFPQTRRTDSKFMPSASVQYNLADNLMVYASYANGFKAGGYDTGANGNVYGPETVNAYEFGLKSQFFDRRLTANFAVFRSNYHDLQETTLLLLSSGAVSTLVQNVARSGSQGIEFNSSARVASWLTWDTNLAYLDSKYTSYPDGACTMYALYLNRSCVQDLSGKRRSYSPMWSGSLGPHVSVPVGSDYHVTVDPLIYFTSRFFESATDDPQLEQAAYTKFDLRIGLAPNQGPWQVAIVGKNLADRQTSQFRQAVVLASGSVQALVDPPRTVGLQVTYGR